MKKKSTIIYQDDSIIAANKPPRLASVPAKDIPMNSTLFGKIQREMEKEIGEKAHSIYPLHRLDFATSGIVLFGKNPSERLTLENIPRHIDTHKTYLALVEGCPPARGSINFQVPARQRKILINAHTEYKVLARSGGGICSLVEVKITTGRKHQIRRHFAELKFPIVLDDDYGSKKFNRRFRLAFRLGRHFLHAWKISFTHPITGKPTQIIAPLAPDLVVTLKRLSVPLPDPTKA